MRIAILTSILFFLSSFTYAEENSALDIGFFKNVSGSVKIVRGKLIKNVETGMQLKAGDTILTSSSSSSGIILKDGTVLTVGELSELQIRQYVFDPISQKYDFLLHMEKGDLMYSSGKLGKLAPEKINLSTPRALVGVRGTRLLLSTN